MKIINDFKSLTAKGLALLTVILAIPGVQAQTAPAQELTLKDAVNYALQNKLEARKAKLAVENAEYQIQEVRSRALPSISASGNLTYNPIIQQTAVDFGQGTQLLALGQKWSSVAGVSLTQNIFDQSVFTGLRAAKTTREFYQVNAELTDEQVIERVANNYYNVYVQRIQLTVVDSNYVNTAKIRDIIKGQFDNGLAKRIDLDRINVTVSNLDAERIQLRSNLEQQENALKFFIGMPIQTAIVLPDTQFEVTPQSLNDTPDTTQLPQYRLMQKQKELYEFNKKAVQAAYYPTLSLTAGYNYIGQGPKMPWFQLSSAGVYWTDFSAIAMNLNIPIFTGFGTRAKVRQADIDIRETEEDLKDTKLSLDLAYSNAKSQMVVSLTNIANQKENVKLAQEVLDDVQNNYQNGLASLTDLLDAETSYITSQRNYTNALLTYKLAEVQLIKAKGELKTLTN
ncbi:TolC family protein [Flavobacterium sp. AG291]|uniref:TolC family protein n=1 Tax=Flavobacterium sp. AG291 TaxID=2184000 RepID=UPI000E0AC088|nr:TolC family protein [Flavobacterium sp. AG291]RDI10269.1 outer membrane protein TolC [Flavobacterium sp. AG291]